jgi:hypothetical protein
MRESPRRLEGIARHLHDKTGIEAPVDALLLAHRLGLTLRPWAKSHGALDGNTIFVPTRYGMRDQRKQFRVAHELGHWALREDGADDTCEASADYLAGALLLPREVFMRDLGATDWDLLELQRLHSNASAQAIVIRMTQVSPATASVWDAGHCHRGYGAPREELEQLDRELAERALGVQEPLRGEVSAWPISSGSWRRVCVVRRAA